MATGNEANQEQKPADTPQAGEAQAAGEYAQAQGEARGEQQGAQQGGQDGQDGQRGDQFDGLKDKKPEELTPDELRLMADTMPGEGPGD